MDCMLLLGEVKGVGTFLEKIVCFLTDAKKIKMSSMMFKKKFILHFAIFLQYILDFIHISLFQGKAFPKHFKKLLEPKMRKNNLSQRTPPPCI